MRFLRLLRARRGRQAQRIHERQRLLREFRKDPHRDMSHRDIPPMQRHGTDWFGGGG